MKWHPYLYEVLEAHVRDIGENALTKTCDLDDKGFGDRVESVGDEPLGHFGANFSLYAYNGFEALMIQILDDGQANNPRRELLFDPNMKYLAASMH